MRAQYAAWPYPAVSVFASVRRTDLWSLHLAHLQDRCGVPMTAGGRIWIAGCGTFQPYAVGLANPQADVLATDVSWPSLRRAHRRCTWHGLGHVRLGHADLTTDALPDGPFDWIECYGVLMNLRDPQATLRRLAQRLAPGGVLRVMVYPVFSRRRIFLVQRVGKLLGLHAGDRRHPALLRRLVRGLQSEHPLRDAFEGYADARDDAGLVDGFLHAGDEGHHAGRLLQLAAAAGLRPAHWVHRPWAQPERMAGRLGLVGTSQAGVLDLLDRWQELRGNLVCCFVRSDAPAPAAARTPRLHPLLSPATPGLQPLERLGVAAARLWGRRLDSRTDAGPIRLAGRTLRALARGDAPDPTDAALAAAVERGLRLGNGPDRPAGARTLPALLEAEREAPYATGAATKWPAPRADDDVLVNPLYEHLLAPLRSWPGDDILPDSARMFELWREHGDPLEGPTVRRGLTLHGTRENDPAFFDALVARRDAPPTTWADLRLADEADLRAALTRRLDRLGLAPIDDAAARELAVLLEAHEPAVLPRARR